MIAFSETNPLVTSSSLEPYFVRGRIALADADRRIGLLGDAFGREPGQTPNHVTLEGI